MRTALERGEDVNAPDGIQGSNQTPLMCSAGQSGDHPFHEKHVSVVRLLLEQPSIEVNLAGNKGATPLHGAYFHRSL